MIVVKQKMICIFFLLFVSTQFVDAQISFKDETKKNLLNTIKPFGGSAIDPNSYVRPELTKSHNSDVLKAFDKTKGYEELPKHALIITPDLTTNRSGIPFSAHIPGRLTTQYEGGHFVQVVPEKGGFSVDISGGGPKFISEKTMNLLRSVYGISVDKKGEPK